MKQKTLYTLCESSVMIAAAIVLSFIEIQIGPSGGSINFTMLPILIIAYRQGALWGMGSGMIFGLVKCIIGGGIGWGLPSILLDYVLAYGVIGIAGVFKRKKGRLILSAVLGCLARYVIHFISGITLYAIMVPTKIETVGAVISNAWAYSAIYNLIYMVPSSIVCIVFMAFMPAVFKQMDKISNK